MCGFVTGVLASTHHACCAHGAFACRLLCPWVQAYPLLSKACCCIFMHTLPTALFAVVCVACSQMLDNIFEPLFEVTRDPASHPQLHVLLSQVRQCLTQFVRRQ
jgi:hypothetical protein